MSDKYLILCIAATRPSPLYTALQGGYGGPPKGPPGARGGAKTAPPLPASAAFKKSDAKVMSSDKTNRQPPPIPKTAPTKCAKVNLSYSESSTDEESDNGKARNNQQSGQNNFKVGVLGAPLAPPEEDQVHSDDSFLYDKTDPEDNNEEEEQDHSKEEVKSQKL